MEANTRALSGTIRNFGYGISDVFANNGPIGAKLGGFANNVGNITTGILGMLGKTGPAALAAAGLEIAFTATGAALTAMGVKSVGDLVRLFTGGAKEAEGALAGLKHRISELEEKPHLIPIETLELVNAKRLADGLVKSHEAVEKLRTGQSHYERESGKTVESTLAEGGVDDAGKRVGGQEIRDRLRADMVRQLTDSDDKIKEALAAEAKAEAKIKGLESRPHTGNDAMVQAEIARQKDAAAAARAMVTARQTAITTGQSDGKGGFTPPTADTQLGDIITAAERGAGERQRAAREALARRLEKAGLGRAADVTDAAGNVIAKAGGVAASAPEDIEEHETVVEQQEDKINRMKARDAARKKDEAAQAERQRNMNAFDKQEAAEGKASLDRGTTKDFGLEAKDALVAGQGRDAVKAKIKAAIRAELDRLNETREAIRDGIAEEMSRSIVGGIGDNDVAKAKEEAKKKADADAARDKKELDDALGDDFLQTMAARRLELFSDPSVTKKDVARFDAALKREAERVLRLKQVEPARAAEMAGRAGGAVDEGVKTGLNQVRAVPGMEGADLGRVMAALHQQLMGQIQARPPAARAKVAPKPARLRPRQAARPVAAPVQVQAPDRPQRGPARTGMARGPAARAAADLAREAERGQGAKPSGFGGPDRAKQMGPAAPDSSAGLGAAMDGLARARADRDRATAGTTVNLASAVQNLAAAELANRQEMAKAAGMASQALALTLRLRRA